MDTPLPNAVATVIVDDGIDKPLDYAIPEALAAGVRAGVRVAVPVGKSVRKGTVQEVKAKSDFPRLVPIREVLGEKALLSDPLFQLAHWISGYYATPLRRVLRSFLPAAVRGRAQEKEQLFVKRACTQKALVQLCETLRGKHLARTQVLEVMLKKPKGVLLTELLELSGVSRSPVDTLIKEGVLAAEKVQIDRSPLADAPFFQTKAKVLTGEQKTALDAILASLGSYKAHLIHGVTGSGKTEVYMQAMEEARRREMGIIVLVPEIALTTQTMERFRARFGEKIAILHHRLSDGERFDLWHQIHKGEIGIVVGARSAIFSPVQNLGLIVVDEEHDSSYKQEGEMPCYHARDVAVYRGYLEKAVVLLGSATPSLESYTNAKKGKYTLHTLLARATSAALPTVSIVNMQHQKGLFSDTLLSGITKRVARGEQVLLFLNRRGYHAFQLCTACKKPIECPHCDLSLTYHKGPGALACHLCGYTTRPPRHCPSCHGETLCYKGFGTEMVERTLNAMLPDIRTLRMDADTTRHKGSHEKLFKQFRAGKADVLIGTQMIAKGFHFPSVTLVGVLGTDATLNLPDYRASEVAYQLLTQVAGRSGRGALAGEVLIQTFHPDHPLYTHAKKEEYPAFYDEEIEARKLCRFPPFSHLAKVTFSGPEPEKTLQLATAYRDALAKQLPADTTLFPVIPGFRAKVKDRYLYTFLLQGPKSPRLHLPHLPTHYRCRIDIDPISSL